LQREFEGMKQEAREVESARDAPSAVKHLTPTVLYVAHVFWSGSSKETGLPLQMSDKVAHAVAFGVTYFRPRHSLPRRIVLAAFVASMIGGLLEFWQFFLPWRSADVFDWIADTAGALVVALAIFALGFVLDRDPIFRRR
jgi:hypothetical protein